MKDTFIRLGVLLVTCAALLAFCKDVKAESYEERVILFEDTCTIASVLFDVSCNLIKTPVILDMDDEGFRGYYRQENENYVWVHSKLDPINRKMVIVHEMAHLILHQSGTVPLSKTNVYQTCLSEVMSFGISNWYAVTVLQNKALQRKNWIHDYPHCHFMKEEYIHVP